MPTNRLNLGMVGGGPGALIGEVHRKAARLDGHWNLVAGCFSSSPQTSIKMGESLGLAADRVYKNYAEMAQSEARRDDATRIDAVAVVTPNHLHYEICMAFIKEGIAVICDKPLTNRLSKALELEAAAQKQNAPLALTYTYSGYAMVKEARALMRLGTLGTLRKVVVEYSQGWLSKQIDETNKQAAWRTDDARGAISSAVADIGTHAEHLVHYITGLQMQRLFADVTSFVEGRSLEDDATILIDYDKGVKGRFLISQVAAGEENKFNVSIYGTEGSLHWQQEAPNNLRHKRVDAPERILKRGSNYLSEAARISSRLPPGHPEGFIEAFGNIYGEIAQALKSKGTTGFKDHDVPSIEEGIAGVRFVEKVIESSRKERWLQF